MSISIVYMLVREELPHGTSVLAMHSDARSCVLGMSAWIAGMNLNRWPLTDKVVVLLPFCGPF
jgi:hypothetical protein